MDKIHKRLWLYGLLQHRANDYIGKLDVRHVITEHYYSRGNIHFRYGCKLRPIVNLTSGPAMQTFGLACQWRLQNLLPSPFE